jgi:pyrroline-5-carboxylate reductase
MKIALIGAGAMGEAIIKGLLGSNLIEKENLKIGEIDEKRVNYLRENYQLFASPSNKEAILEAEIIILAVKPSQARGVLQEIKNEIQKKQWIISIMAGISTSQIEEIIGKELSVIRIMPNLPALVGKGISALAAGKFADLNHIEEAKKIFQSIGKVVVVKEELISAVTGLSGSGPAYVFLFMEALKEAGVRLGLSKEDARLLAVETTWGTAYLAAKTEEPLATLKEKVTTPGGTTIEGLYVLEKYGFKGILMEAIEKAAQKAERMKK